MRLSLGLLVLLPLTASAAPTRDFYASFSDHIVRTETGFLQSANQFCSTAGCGVQASDGWLMRAQLRAVTRAAEKTLEELYAIRSLGRTLTERPTDAKSAGLGAVAGAIILFVDGLHARTTVAGYKVALDVASGRRLRSDSAARLASVELSRSGDPLALTAGFGRQAPVFGMRYALRY